MSNFILTNNGEVNEDNCKLKQDSRIALNKCEKHEEELEAFVQDWKKSQFKMVKKEEENQKTGCRVGWSRRGEFRFEQIKGY